MPDLSSLKSIGLRGWRLMQRVGVGERVLWTAATGLPAVGINASRAHVRLAAVNVRKVHRKNNRPERGGCEVRIVDWAHE